MKVKKKVEGEVTGQARPTIWDVAKLSGVSIATVSRVLKGQTHYISTETKGKVLDAVQELGYVPHRRAPEATPGPTLMIGVTSVAMSIDPFTQILEGITEALHASNARPVICPIPRRHNCNMTLLERLMHGETTGGLIVGSTERDEDIQEALQSGFPCVVIYPERPAHDDIPVVSSADWKGAKTATEYLLELGHTRVGMVRRSQSHMSQERFAGFQSVLLGAGLPLQPDYLYDASGDNKESGYQAGKHLLALPEPPTALFASNDFIAAGLLQAAQEMGVRVPQDLSVVGFGDMSFTTMITPELTTVRQPFIEMGRVGVDMLVRLLEGRTLEVTRVELTARLVVRSSTAPRH